MVKAAERGDERIGRYSVICRLARGGMAEVFLVRATGLQGFQKVVALKRILPRYAGDPEFIRMFLDEARLAANLDHPNIAAVHDIGREGEDYFFTMEYVHGETLRAILGRAPASGLPLAQAVAIGIGVAAGIAHAHERIGYDGTELGLVHRDISPTNVIVSYDGVVKVLDFGIAKAATTSHVTSEGTRKGKVAYMSPEQVRDEPLDPRSDIFAIGILLWEMATRRRLFDGQNDFAIMRKILDAPVAVPSTIEPQVPPDLDAIILRALAADPAARFQSAADLQRALETLARDHRYDATIGGLRGYMATAFGSRPFPWQDAPDIAEVRADGSILATADLPPTRPGAPPSLAVLGAVPEATETSWAPPPRRGRALLVGGALAAAIGAAWFAWPRDAPAPDTPVEPSNDRPPADDAPAPATAPALAPEPSPSPAPPEASPPSEAPAPASSEPKADRPRASRRGSSSRPSSRPRSKTEPKAPSADKPEYDRLFDF